MVAGEGGAVQAEGGRERLAGVVAGLAGGVGTDADNDPGRGACQYGEVGQPAVGRTELVGEPEVLISYRLRVPVAANICCTASGGISMPAWTRNLVHAPTVSSAR